MKRFLLIPLLASFALTTEPSPTFILPKAKVLIAGPRGVDILVQTRIVPNAANRWFRLDWPEGSTGKSLNGEDESALQPETPLKVRVSQNTTFIATVLGAGGQVLAQNSFELRVCGGGEEGC